MIRESRKLAVALHLFDYRLLEEFEHYLSNITCAYTLFVTVPDDGAPVRKVFPHARIYANHPNIGMDIGGFFAVLPDIQAAGYELVLKLHSKNSATWRRQLLDPLCGSVKRVQESIKAFENTNVGAVGSEVWSCSFAPDHWAWRCGNIARVEELCQQWGQSTYKQKHWQFIGGTMFWMRVSVLRSAFQDMVAAKTIATLNGINDCDTGWYAQFYPDLYKAGVRSKEELLNHWNQYGKAENRAPNGYIARSRELSDVCDGMIEHAYERFFGVLVANCDKEWKLLKNTCETN